MPKPEPIKEKDKILDPKKDGAVITHPSVGHDGKAITQKPLANSRGRVIAPRHDNATVINNTTIINNITQYNRYETTRNYYYWHEDLGHHYCHYYDTWGYHWYGWYVGSDYFWTRWHYDRWWWYDPYYERWCYWRNGQWWWQDPYRAEVVYIYTDDNYYRYDSSRGGVVLEPDPTPPVQEPPAQNPAPTPDPKQVVFYSNDGTRMVQIFGDKADAFLYDTADPPAFDPLFLASGVKEVQFSDTENGEPLQILIVIEKTVDGKSQKTFKLFDGNGQPYSAQPPAEPQPQPAPPSDGQPPSEGQSENGGPEPPMNQGLRESAAFDALSGRDIGW